MARLARLFLARSALSLLIGVAAVLGCEAIAGYSDLEPWPPDSSLGGSPGSGGSGASAGRAGAAAGGDSASKPDTTLADRATADDARDSQLPINDVSVEAEPMDQDAGPCPILTGNDACATVPHFIGTQVIDGIGNEFCNIPAMEFDVASCPTIFTYGVPRAMPEKVFLRIGWSTAAFHLHVKVVDPSVIVNPVDGQLYSGDCVEIFIAGTSGAGLHGSYNGTNDGGAIQIVLAPPANGFPTRGQAFFNPGGGVHSNVMISPSIYAGRMVPDGYELELKFNWVAFADPAVPGGKIAFDLAVGTQVDQDAGGRQLQCIISDVVVDGRQACGYAAPRPAEPWCDNRTWCQPTLSP